MKKFLILDTETGGLDPFKHSLLTLYIAEAFLKDGKFTIGEELDLKIKPDSGVYNITSGAMKVNMIDIVKHEEEAMAETEASKALYNFLLKTSSGGAIKQTVMGHNVKFDINFITSQLLKESIWNAHVSYHHFDTVSLATVLKIQDKLHPNTGLSLGKLAKTLKIQKVGDLHNAKYDAQLCLEVAEKMLAM